jgi:ribosomal RNA-processing protein 7
VKKSRVSMDVTVPGGYVRVPVASEGGAVLRFVYAKQHKAKDDQTPRDRTLFVTNLPGGLEDAEIFDGWQRAYGRVEEVRRAATTPGSALIVFKKASTLAKALSAGERAVVLPTGAAVGPSRAQKWAVLRDRALKEAANDYMLKFDADVAAKRETAAAAEGVPEDDGFITVSRTAKRAKTDEAADGELADGDGGKKKKKKSTELQDFYHFQQHERKREHLHKLRQRFEQDKARIAVMKAQRRFRPE